MSESWTPGPWTVANEGDVFYVPELQAQYTEANARLIAAAPEMAEILMELERDADFLTIPSFATQHAIALLSRIRGEA